VSAVSSERMSDSDRQMLVGALDRIESDLTAISTWLPGPEINVRRLLTDARDKLAAASWGALRM
jgi:hypothetical protein